MAAASAIHSADSTSSTTLPSISQILDAEVSEAKKHKPPNPTTPTNFATPKTPYKRVLRTVTDSPHLVNSRYGNITKAEALKMKKSKRRLFDDNSTSTGPKLVSVGSPERSNLNLNPDLNFILKKLYQYTITNLSTLIDKIFNPQNYSELNRKLNHLSYTVLEHILTNFKILTKIMLNNQTKILIFCCLYLGHKMLEIELRRGSDSNQLGDTGISFAKLVELDQVDQTMSSSSSGTNLTEIPLSISSHDKKYFLDKILGQNKSSDKKSQTEEQQPAKTGNLPQFYDQIFLPNLENFLTNFKQKSEFSSNNNYFTNFENIKLTLSPRKVRRVESPVKSRPALDRNGPVKVQSELKSKDSRPITKPPIKSNKSPSKSIIYNSPMSGSFGRGVRDLNIFLESSSSKMKDQGKSSKKRLQFL